MVLVHGGERLRINEINQDMGKQKLREIQIYQRRNEAAAVMLDVNITELRTNINIMNLPQIKFQKHIVNKIVSEIMKGSKHQF